MRKTTKFLSVALAATMLFGCASSKDTSKTNNSGSTESASGEIKAKNKPSFEDANILQFNEIKKYTDSTLGLVAWFKITNKGKNPIYYFSPTFNFLDKDGNQLCDDSRFREFEVDSNKSACIQTYSSFDDNEMDKVKKIKTIEIKSYEYYTADKQYTVDLQNKTVEVIKREDYNNANFNEKNVLSFSTTPKTNDGIHVDYTIKNTGSNPIKELSYNVVYQDKDKNIIDEDSRFTDSLLNPNKSVSSTSYYTQDYFESDVKNYKTTSYEYTLTKKDENGFNHYVINLEQKTCKGSFDE